MISDRSRVIAESMYTERVYSGWIRLVAPDRTERDPPELARNSLDRSLRVGGRARSIRSGGLVVGSYEYEKKVRIVGARAYGPYLLRYGLAAPARKLPT